VLDAGGLPVQLQQHVPAVAMLVHEGFDRLILVGGDDLDPSEYGQDDRGVNKGVSASADASDQAFARAALELDLPLFAICRGCQVLNVAMGGTLHQDMTAPGTSHPPISDEPAEVMGLRHSIVVDADSRLAKAYGGDLERVVNSIHHQAIDRLAPGYRAVARASDGVIEAIEPDDRSRRVLAVQWHPEKINGEGDHVLFDHFVHEMIR
jgi:putative glutamine amidotransferase